MNTTYRSIEEAAVGLRNRRSAKLPTFPAKVWAEGRSPGKEPLVVHDEMQFRGGIETALYVSRDEHHMDGAVVEWSS